MVYANESDITSMIKFTDDEADDGLINTAMKNADSWIDSKLLSHSLSIWTVADSEENPIPHLLTTAANYYACSDILQALYGSDDRSTNEQAYFEKAETMLMSYIQQQLDELAATELARKNPINHRIGKTYNQIMRRIR